MRCCARTAAGIGRVSAGAPKTRFSCILRAAIPRLKAIGAYLYLWDALKWYDASLNLTRHTVIASPAVFSDPHSFGCSAAEWAYRVVCGEARDYGLPLAERGRFVFA